MRSNWVVRLKSIFKTMLMGAVVLALGLIPASGVNAQKKTAQSKTWRLDDFDKTHSEGDTYGKWDLEKISPVFGSGESTFFQFVHEGDDKHYIHLKSGKNNSFSVGLKDPFEVADWPVMSWEWKAVVLPKNGDVRVEAHDDQAGSICLIVNPGLFGFKSLCYLWENDGPMDQPITSTKRDDSRYLILRTKSKDGVGQWKKENRNVLADYRRVFGEVPDEKAIIGMQIDSDSTESAGEIFYRNIVLSRP